MYQSRKKYHDKRRMLKAPPLISSDLHLLVLYCDCRADDDNIIPKLKKAELCNIGGVKYV